MNGRVYRPMIFNSKVVQKYILSGARIVATIRRNGYYRVGQKVALKVANKTLYGEVIAIAPITLDSLSRYVDYSGFDSVEEWLYEARKLHHTEIDPSNYEIIVVEIISQEK